MRWRHLLVALVALLAISAMPATAQNASAVASEHTTFGTAGGEPSPMQLTKMTVQGSGESASVIAGNRAEMSPDSTIESTDRRGVVFEPLSDISGIQTEVTDLGSGITTVYILDSSGSVVTSQSASHGDTVSFNVGLSAGTEYRLVADAGGSTYQSGYDSSPGYPIGGGGVTIRDGYSGGIITSNSAYNFKYLKSLSAGVESATYVGAPHNAEDIQQAWTNLTLQNAEATVTWQEDADGDGTWTNVSSTTVSSSGNVTQDLSATESDRWRVRVDIEATGSYPTAEIHDEGLLFESSSPTLSDPNPTGEIADFDGDISINVSDRDLGLAQGDTVVVEAVDGDGTQIGQQSVTSNGTVSFSYGAVAGANTVEWTATDSYGNSESVAQEFSTPDNLYIRPESDPDALVNGSDASIEVRFYAEDSIYTRTTSDGVVSLAGLPADARFAVVVSADGYYRRRAIIDSLFEQQSVYLLNESKSAVEKQFVLNDVSGSFPAQSTRIYVQRSISNSTDYRTVAADYFGATSAFSTFLQTDQRYRIIIENDQGDRRTLGSYTPVSASVERLKIEGVGLYEESQDGYVANSSTRRLDNGQRQVIVRYHDPAAATSRYQVRVHERGDPANVTFEETVSDGPVQNYSAYVDVANDTSYVVNWSATRNGQQISGTRPIGGGDLGIRIPLPDQWLGTIGLVIIVFVGSLAGERYATHLALAVVAFAGVLMYLAVIDLFIPGWWGALLIASGGHLAQRRPAS